MQQLEKITAYKKMPLPLFVTKLRAGFPFPADDYVDIGLDLNEYLVKHEQATFYVKASGDSMLGAGIHTGDILIVDKSLEPKQNSVIVASINGEFTVKHFFKNPYGVYLVASNPKYKPIQIKEEMNFEIWGVVTYVIHPV